MHLRNIITVLMAGSLFALYACSTSESDESDAGDDGAKQPGADASADGDADADSDVDAGDDAGGEREPLYPLDPDRIYEDVEELSSAEYEGRAPGTEGNEKAIKFVADRFDELELGYAQGLDVYTKDFTYLVWDLTGTSELEVNGETLTQGPDFSVFEYSGGGEVTGEVVFVGYGMTVPAFKKADYPDCPLDTAGYDDYAGVDVTDKIALVLRRVPGDSEEIQNGCPANEPGQGEEWALARFSYKAKNARLHGAKAMILVQNYNGEPEHGEGATLAEDHPQDFPAVFAHRDRVDEQITDLETWAGEIDDNFEPDSHATGINATVNVKSDSVEHDSTNIFGVFEGQDAQLKDEVIIVGAHIDGMGKQNTSIYYGADDNASGTAVMLEMARAMKETDFKPARTMLFAGFNANIPDLYGSCNYANIDPIYPMEDTFIMFSLDMVGAGEGSGVYLAGADAPEDFWIVDLMNKAAEAEGISYAVAAESLFTQSDNVCFMMNEIPAFMISTLWQDMHQYSGTPDDTIDTITTKDLQAAAELTWVTLKVLAMGEEDDYVQN